MSASGRSADDDQRQQSYDPDTANVPLLPESRTATPAMIFWFWAASGTSVAVLPSGVIIAGASGMNAPAAVLAVVVGLVLAGLVLVLVSLTGQRTGRATLSLSGDVFGPTGNRLPLAISFVVLVGWCSVMAVLAVYSVDAILRQFGIVLTDAARILVLVIFAGLLILMVGLGYRLIQVTQKWIALAVGLVIVGLTIDAAVHTDWGTTLSVPLSGIEPVVAGVVIAMTSAASGWWNSGADFSRFLAPDIRERTVVRVVMAGMSGIAIILLAGCFVFFWQPDILQEENPVVGATQELSAVGAVVGIAIALLGLHAATVTNLYSASLNLNTFGLRSRSISVTVCAVAVVGIGTWVLLGATSFYEWFQAFLTVLGVPIAAWAGVYVVPAVVSRTWPEAPARIVWWPMVWLLLGIAVGLGFLETDVQGLSWVGYLSALAPGFAAAGGGVLVAFVISFIGAWVTRRHWLSTAID